MNGVGRIIQTETLERRIMRYYKLLERNREALRNLQKECRHEVAVCTEHSRCYGGLDDRVFRKCLFCGIESGSHGAFCCSEIINVAYDEKFTYFNRDERFEIVKRLYMKIAMANPKLCALDLKKTVEENISNSSVEFKEIVKEVYDENKK